MRTSSCALGRMETAEVIAGCYSKKGRATGTRPHLFLPIDQDAFFLRNASTNLISSIVPSQSLVVAGLKPFFWPSDSRSNAALSLVGDSVNALAIAAFRSAGRSEL